MLDLDNATYARRQDRRPPRSRGGRRVLPACLALHHYLAALGLIFVCCVCFVCPCGRRQRRAVLAGPSIATH